MKYVLGLDFGTLSCRALVAEASTGREMASAVCEYRHAVMDTALPSGRRLPPDWALQDAEDYLNSMRQSAREALEKAAVAPQDVIGVGVDFTTCTMVAVDEAGTPLSSLPEFRDNPHAYVKLWKHHAAEEYARRMTRIAEARGETFLMRYGGKVSSEWFLPKLWQVLEEAPEVWRAAHRFIDAGDWMVLRLTGQEARSSTLAGYKALWSKAEGYPSEEYLAALDERLRHVVDEKLSRQIHPVGEKAGELTGEAAGWLGLLPGTAVGVALADGHGAIPGAGITRPGRMLLIMGTSTCHMTLSDRDILVPGICGTVADGMMPGYYGIEAGQACVGDHFDWFVHHCLPEEYAREAEERGISPHQLLTERAQRLRPGESGLLALDWWNGNRSMLVDYSLSGLMLGMTLTTRPEEAYRALIEATAYGTRAIIEGMERHGVSVDSLAACGGLSKKNPMLMQIYADVTGRKIHVCRSSQTSALGAAMAGAVAAGPERGGYMSLSEASEAMNGGEERVYVPIPENQAVYEKLYAEYMTLHDYFGRGGNDVMKRLKALRRISRAEA